MTNTLTLGYSTCPNDTYIFHALASGLIDTGQLAFDISLADVETLNQQARTGALDVSKLSFAAIGHLAESYALLRSGAALGRGCGPLVVARPNQRLEALAQAKIAVPGLWTTACMLLALYLQHMPDVDAMPFENIMPAVADGEYDVGLIIHESRFTYPDYGLVSLLDLGQWWEAETGLPIPLGGIAIRRDIPSEVACAAERAIRDSLEYAGSHPGAADAYIERHAQEMAPDVIKQHIDLYVNDFSLNLGREGEAAIERLFQMGRDRGILPAGRAPLFACVEG